MLKQPLKPRPLAEVFTTQKKLIKIEDKVNNLRWNATPGLYYVLHLALKPEVKWLLPEGMGQFTRDVAANAAAGLTPSNLNRELRILYLFLDGGGTALSQARRELLFANFLERLHSDEIAMIEALKDGTFANKYRVPKKVVDEAFPGLLDMQFFPRFLK